MTTLPGCEIPSSKRAGSGHSGSIGVGASGTILPALGGGMPRLAENAGPRRDWTAGAAAQMAFPEPVPDTDR